MFLAHLPAGYIVSKFLLTKFNSGPSRKKYLLFLGLLGSVFPDLDMLYFYLIDNRQHGHHSYWSHIPVYWICLLGICYVIAAIIKSRFFAKAATIFVTCILLHLLLDSFAGGGIKWLHPFSDSYLSIFSIPSRQGYWLWNYFLHWTALVELTIIGIATTIFIKTDWEFTQKLRRKI